MRPHRILFAVLVLSVLVRVSHGKGLAPVNANTAPVDSLAAHLPGVGPAVAERIVAGRPYRTCSDISETVRGIGEKKIAKICPFLTF